VTGQEASQNATQKAFTSLLRFPSAQTGKANSECAEARRGKPRIATVSVRIDDVCLTTHVGPTEASDADLVAALECAVSRLRRPPAAKLLRKAA
jgi:hypothetical protein